VSDMQTYAMSVSACLKFAPLGKGLRVYFPCLAPGKPTNPCSLPDDYFTNVHKLSPAFLRLVKARESRKLESLDSQREQTKAVFASLHRFHILFPVYK
jgi:hypothetical protein